SLALLAEIMRPPDAPSLLCVAIVRTDAGLDLEALARELGDDVRPLPLGGLRPAEARQLVELLAADAGTPLPADAVTAIGSEAAGHPLFIDEMVRHERLPDDDRRIIALAATAGAPLWLETAARAAGIEELSRFSEHVQALRA